MKLTTNIVVRFGPRLEHTNPPLFPKPRRRFGDACWRATCYLHDAETAALLGTLSGYDTGIDICEKTEHACRLQLKDYNNKVSCTPAQLTLLAMSSRECSGQVFFTIEGKTKRIV